MDGWMDMDGMTLRRKTKDERRKDIGILYCIVLSFCNAYASVFYRQAGR